MPQGHEDSTGTLPPASAMQACRHQVLSSLAILRSLGGPAIGAHAHAERFGRAEESRGKLCSELCSRPSAPMMQQPPAGTPAAKAEDLKGVPKNLLTCIILPSPHLASILGSALQS